jgi:hypothetical protein
MAHQPEVQDQALKQALVVGGQYSFVKDKLAKSLARHGVGVHTHWSWDKKRPPQTFPQGIDLVYICTDMVGHGLSEPCMSWARDQGLPYVNGTRKWAESIVRLTQGGFPLLNPLQTVPEIIKEIRLTRSDAKMAKGPNAKERHAIAVAFTGDVATASDLVAAYNATSGNIELEALAHSHTLFPSISTQIALMESPIMPQTGLNMHLLITHPKQREYVRFLAFNPDSDNVALWHDLENTPLFSGSKFDPERGSHARRALGINIIRKGGLRRTTVDLARFRETVSAAKIEGCPTPQAEYCVGTHEPVAPKKLSPVAPAPAPAPAPVVAVAPAARPELKLAPSAESSEPWPNDDFKTLLSMLREHMSGYGIKTLTITETGVSFKRIKIVEGELEI